MHSHITRDSSDLVSALVHLPPVAPYTLQQLFLVPPQIQVPNSQNGHHAQFEASLTQVAIHWL